jgi:hypothetical protein
MKYFKDNEFKDISKLKQELLTKLDNYRLFLDEPVTITGDYSLSGHSPNSEHETGEAVDCLSKSPLWWQYMCAVKAGFVNIGLYPMWNGLHLGIRKSDIDKRWIGLGDDSSQQYVTFNRDNFEKYILGGEKMIAEISIICLTLLLNANFDRDYQLQAMDKNIVLSQLQLNANDLIVRDDEIKLKLEMAELAKGVIYGSPEELQNMMDNLR